MSKIYSQHTESIAIFYILKDHPVRCDSELGLESLKTLSGASMGASGAKLLQGRNQGYPVVIKAFPVDCPFNYIRGRQRKKNTVRDYGNCEIGTGLMLTNTFILTHLTQNIVTCYNYTICDYSYETDISMCHKTSIPKQQVYPIINDNTHPLYSYYEPYFFRLRTLHCVPYSALIPLINGISETGDRGDNITRYFMVKMFFLFY